MKSMNFYKPSSLESRLVSLFVLFDLASCFVCNSNFNCLLCWVILLLFLLLEGFLLYFLYKKKIVSHRRYFIFHAAGTSSLNRKIFTITMYYLPLCRILSSFHDHFLYIFKFFLIQYIFVGNTSTVV